MNTPALLFIPSGGRLALIGAALVLLVSNRAGAQTTSPTSADNKTKVAAESDDTIKLTPFTVSTDKDDGFVATSALAGGRLATDLRDTPAAYSVITREFIDALNLIDLQGAAEWSTGSADIPNNGDATFFTFSTTIKRAACAPVRSSAIFSRSMATTIPSIFSPAAPDDWA